MDDRKIAFIICRTDKRYYEECVKYLEDLTVPEGYCTDVLSVVDVASTAEGYNEAMQASDAKYKVYLREDVFLLNKYFIADVLDILENNRQIGMLGVRGTDKLPENADCNAAWNVGNIREYDGRCLKDTFELRQPAAKYESVAAVDGVLMVTQYDIPWRGDLTEGWNLYGVSQSIEMRRQGYEVVVPRQEQPWCYCDNSILNSRDYDICREGLMRIYPEIFSVKEIRQEREQHQKEQEMAIEMRQALVWLMEMHLYDEARAALGKQRFNWMPDMQAQEIANMMEIYFLEEASVSKKHSNWFALQNWSKIYVSYQTVRWTVLRLGYGRSDERIPELKRMVDAGEISKDAIRKIANVSLPDTTGIFRYFWTEKKEQPLVSVCVPVYNAGDFLQETLESVLNQTYHNMEIIVIDDASVDGSREKILAYKDERIRPVFLEKNRHVCYAGNEGFELAQGKYVALIGHDDIWGKDKIEKQVTFLEEHPAYNLCFSWADIIDEDGCNRNSENRDIYQRFCSGNYPAKIWIRNLLESNNFFCAPSVCIRREALRESGYYRYALVQLQDYDLWLRLLKTGEVHIFQEKLTRYRRFFEKGKNVSEDNARTRIRDAHERQWIHYSYVNDMSAQEFLTIFNGKLKNPTAAQEKEVLCEKALWLWEGGNCFAEDMFARLLEDEECRNILEEEYGVGLKDFYEMNTRPMLFDDSAMDVIKNKNTKLTEYEKRIEHLEEKLCKS